jgi:hypothetical protein
MMTLYCYEELPYKVQQEVDKRVKQTTSYKKYVQSFYKERLERLINSEFIASDYAPNINVLVVYSLEDIYTSDKKWFDIFNSISYDLDNKQIKVDVSVDETIDFNNLYDFIHSVTYKFSHIMQNIIDEAISINPDMGQFLTDKSFTEDGREVEISFK